MKAKNEIIVNFDEKLAKLTKVSWADDDSTYEYLHLFPDRPNPELWDVFNMFILSATSPWERAIPIPKEKYQID